MTTSSAPRRIALLQLGLGGVGRALVRQVLATTAQQAAAGVQFTYVALADSTGMVRSDGGLSPARLDPLLAAKQEGQSLAALPAGRRLERAEGLLEALPAGEAVVVDATAAEAAVVAPLLRAARARGAAVVTANKKSLSGEMDLWHELTRGNRMGYEATVGAGLPVISTLQTLRETGDEITRIRGVLSGTLGFLMSEIESGIRFSEALRQAQREGWTEPDPRDDLSGLDVARKLLILARSLGLEVSAAEVEVEPLYPPAYAELSQPHFLARLTELDSGLLQRRNQAHDVGQRLRYVASLEGGPERAPRLRVGTEMVDADDALGTLQGPDNLIAFTTRRYAAQPLVIRGAGAGVEVTAAAMLGDLYRLARS